MSIVFDDAILMLTRDERPKARPTRSRVPRVLPVIAAAVALAVVVVVAAQLVRDVFSSEQFAGRASSVGESGGSDMRDQSSADPRAYHPSCLEKETVQADVDGDGLPDLVYHDWIRDRAVLGVCTAVGDNDRMRGEGQAELLQIIDIEQDGRDEIFFGGTTVGAKIAAIAVFNDELQRVRLRNRGTLLVVDGLDPGIWSRHDPAGAAFGCKDVDEDGHRELIQVSVRPQGPAFRWISRAFSIEGAVATRAMQRTGRAENVPNKPDEREVMEIARGLVKPCSSN